MSEIIPALLPSSVKNEDNARAHILATRLGEPLPLTDAELGAMKESSRPEFLARYALKIWRYYVSKGISQNVIPAAWGRGGAG